ncbi:tannase/feruloyl esterase family alpha/beta hydrolase [Actinoplanes sp. TRM 88003]|uniref:Tannase/feruloyl esterase family alpha/beta hydrolase n=1 Tax=Paractinoplanes aksuensis TaxID=2939490 RepID=A0ABT1DV77_9ACTN|nr:tannase/feruloyl esterase family alpha/beta hydrolase [Actinoplanes aksuensis]MCO8273865.1 tannase/feruloyl esterase family alpha/beta hydrolase [Actinoplanes aksuensis]
MKRRLIVLFAAAALPAATVLVPMAANAVAPTAAACAAVPVSAPTGTKVVKVTAVANAGGTVTFPSNPPLPDYPPITAVPAWCDITVTVTHPGAQDTVAIKVSLPRDKKQWNGRFQATGGSAYLAGELLHPLVVGVKGGYATAATDAGVGADPLDPSPWAGNAALVQNFASRSLHDLAVVGRSVTKNFYQRAASYAYWNGCSTGGRQGYAEAQNHPVDFDGILAKAPAIDWARFAVGTAWSQAVFNERKVKPGPCELEAFNTAAVKACDTLDGVADGIIDNPQDCHWDARKLSGTSVVCDGRTVTVTRALADAVNEIWAGPKGYPGPNKGVTFAFLATPGTPFFVADAWVKFFVAKNPAYDLSKINYKSFHQLYASSQKQYDSVIGTNDADLSKFARAGGKLITWHGQSDQLIPTQATVRYRERVNAALGGNRKVDDFYRLFLVPGADHCGATGPTVTDDDALAALIKWVEHGQAPSTLPAAGLSPTGVTVDHPVCSYPKVARWTGHGPTTSAANYRCVRA